MEEHSLNGIAAPGHLTICPPRMSTARGPEAEGLKDSRT